MSLAEALAAGPTAVRKGPRCSIGILMAGMSRDDRAALNSAFDDPEWTSTSIGKMLDEHAGFKCSPHTVQRHRRGECTCEPR